MKPVSLNFQTNPYNSIGQLHNDTLAYIAANMPDKPTVEKLIALAAEYGKVVLSACDGSVPVFTLSRIEIIVAFGMNQFYDVREMYGLLKFTPEQIRYVEMLFTVPPSILPPNYEKYYQDIDWEILTSTALTTENKRLPLLASAIAKYSAQYWYAQVTAQDSPWKAVWGQGTTHHPSHVPKWVKGDAIGGLVGGAQAASEWWWTGEGDIVATGIGALWGAVGGSLAAL